jgi:hypothetical protein
MKPVVRKITNNAEKESIIKRASDGIHDAIAHLHLPIEENERGDVRLTDEGFGKFGGREIFTNGYQIYFRGDATKIRVDGFAAPDSFFDTRHEIDVYSFLGRAEGRRPVSGRGRRPVSVLTIDTSSSFSPSTDWKHKSSFPSPTVAVSISNS